MKAEITKMIKRHFYDVEGTPEKSAAEIESHVFEFMEWKDLNTITDKITRTSVKYMLLDMNTPAYWMSPQEIYNHWWNNIKNK